MWSFFALGAPPTGGSLFYFQHFWRINLWSIVCVLTICDRNNILTGCTIICRAIFLKKWPWIAGAHYRRDVIFIELLLWDFVVIFGILKSTQFHSAQCERSPQGLLRNILANWSKTHSMRDFNDFA